MKRLLWFSSRDERPVIEIVLSVQSAQWVLDHLPERDGAHDELRRAIVECNAETENEQP